MPEIVAFVNRGASAITPATVEKIVRQLPHWKLEFSQIQAPNYPHLVDQLEFLSNAVEDAADGTFKELPYYAIAQAAYALVYSHRKLDIIPDGIHGLGKADDSSVVRAVLIQNEKAFARYAASQDIDLATVTSKP